MVSLEFPNDNAFCIMGNSDGQTKNDNRVFQ
jgi:hypothetical protein